MMGKNKVYYLSTTVAHATSIILAVMGLLRFNRVIVLKAC